MASKQTLLAVHKRLPQFTLEQLGPAIDSIRSGKFVDFKKLVLGVVDLLTVPIIYQVPSKRVTSGSETDWMQYYKERIDRILDKDVQYTEEDEAKYQELVKKYPHWDYLPESNE